MKNKKIFYLIAGGFNTIFGYGAGILCYFLFKNIFNTLTISLVANIFTISTSFLTYKLFVFKTKGNWLDEYLKCFLVYGSITIKAIILMVVLVDYCHIPFWFAQALAMFIIMIASYIGHNRFTFNKKIKLFKNKL